MKKEKKQNKIKIILAIILSSVVLVVGGFIFIMYQAASSMGIGSGEVADYDTRIEIWDTVAGNSNRSKLDDMNIDYNSNSLLSIIAFANAIVGDSYKDNERIIDTFTYNYEITGGYEKETYEDEPYLIPYVVDGSNSAVIVIPGGGYGYKSMDGTTGEGKDIAMSLNEAGISAFVLHYRSNPYENPIPQLDVQRAVRYLRANASEFGFEPENIGLIGFSAGGNQIGTYINVIRGEDYFPEEYTPDEVDMVDDSVIAAGMIYPALTYEYNVPMLFCSYNADDVRDERKRNELLAKTNLTEQFNSSNVPQFISYGTKDGMVNLKGTKAYIDVAKAEGTDLKVVVAEEQDHGFKQKYYMEDFLTFFKNKTK